MCGITGIIQNKKISRKIIENMTKSLSHRGPDAEGIYFQHNSKFVKNSDLFVALGQRRLSIIDLSAKGKQPMSNSEGTIWITFNGEIYNFLELKKNLIQKGYKFHSQTDTEVIIYGYQEYGPDFFSKMNGMFAFALWDCLKERLLLVRDRFGQKPLYYWKNQNGIVFSSEMKGILKHPDFSKELDLKNLSRYLSFEYLPAPYSILKNIKKVSQGTFIDYDFSKKNFPKTEKKYWKINFSKKEDSVDYSSQKKIEKEIIKRFKKSIKMRLMSDVPLGIFLSGGIDSSSIIALLSEMTDTKKIQTFSIGFNEKSFDESSYASQVAQLYKTDHHEKILDSKKMMNILPEIFEKLDEPFADASIIPTYLLSKFTRKHVTVALGGDGGDELFAGYDPFLAHFWAKFYEKIPKSLHDKILKPLAEKLPVSTKNMSLDFKIKHFLKGVYNKPEIRNQIWLGAFSPTKQKNLLASKISQKLKNFNPYSQLDLDNMVFKDEIQKISYVYQKFYLADDILVKVDRAAMMNSLETRTPFLDFEFANFVNSIPSNFKFRKTTRKYIFKKALEKYLPKNILYRQKKGFGIPLTKWINSDLKNEIKHLFRKEKIEKEGIFNFDYINTILEQHFRRKKDNRKEIWALYTFEKWKENFLN